MWLDGGAMFGVVPKPLWARRTPADDRNRIPLAMRCLLVETDEATVLIDTGLGNKENEKFHDIYRVDNGGDPTRLETSLAELGVERFLLSSVLRGVVAQRGGLIRPSTWGKIKAASQFAAIFLAFLRLAQPWGPWYLDQWVMLIAVGATMGSAWGYVSAFWHTVRSEPHEAKT